MLKMLEKKLGYGFILIKFRCFNRFTWTLEMAMFEKVKYLTKSELSRESYAK